MPAYTATGSTISGWHVVSLTAAAANATVNLTSAAAFASVTGYVCYGSDITKPGAHVTFTYKTGSQFQYQLDGSGSSKANSVSIVCEGH